MVDLRPLMDAREPQQWVLRRIGPPASLPEIADITELKRGSTVFGRGAGADVYIDSRVLKNFISRRHAVIVGETGEDHQLHFTLNNHGLNGTYVNDVRIGAVHQLQEGDKITFGHKNGFKVKVGETAPQDDSEFQFVLECMASPRQAVPLLGERLCQETRKGVTCLAEYDRSECHTFPAKKNGGTPSRDTGPTSPISSVIKSRSFQPKQQVEVPSRPPQRKYLEGSRSPLYGSPEIAGPSKIQTITGAKQPVPFNSKSPEHSVESGGFLLPLQGHSDDSIPKPPLSDRRTDDECSETKHSVQGHPFSRPNTSSSNSKSPRPVHDILRSPWPVQDISRSPRHVQDISRSPRHVLDQSRSPRPVQDSTRSPRPVQDILRSPRAVHDWSRSPRHVQEQSKSPRPVRDLPRSPKPAHDRSRSPGHVHNRSQSPKPQRITRSRSRSPAPTHLLEALKMKDQSGRDDRTLLSGYDEPPVLTPESIVRTPSPSFDGEMEEEDDFDEIESDRESVGWEIPPTPGRSLREASPHPHATVHIRKTVVAHRSAVRTAPKTLSRKGSIGGDETDYGGERHTKHIGLEKSDYKGEKLERQLVSSSKRKKTDVRSLFDELDKNVTSSGKHKESGAESKLKVRRNFKDSAQELSSDDDDDDVFENSSSSQGTGKHFSFKGKQRHSSGSGLDSQHRSSKQASEDSRGPSKPKRPLLEKENGFAEGPTPSKYPSGSARTKDRGATNGTQLLDVRVSVERVTTDQLTKTKHKQDTSVMLKHRSQDGGSSSGKEKQPGKEIRTGRKEQGSADKKSVKAELLFGQEKNKTQRPSESNPRSLASQDKGRAFVSRERTVVSKEKGGIDFSGDWLMNEIETKKKPLYNNKEKLQRKKEKDKMKETLKEKPMSEKKTVSEKKVVSEKSRDRKSSSESHDSFFNMERQTKDQEQVSSEIERENPRPVRKIAMRRPRFPKDSEDKKDSQRPSSAENKPAPKRDRRRRRRKKRKSVDEDDDLDPDDEDDDEAGNEMLEDGVTWYEEECCDSDNCSRPKDRRVEWVQCDDCDKWYHTVCVGCNLEEVRDEDFHCGCV